jgi:tRNA(fMet)-specific endonuclease VapC
MNGFANGNEFAIAAPVLFEFLFGIRTLPRAAQNVEIWNKIKGDFIYFAIDSDDAERAVNLKLELRRKGWQLELVDAFTAVVALRYDLILLTKDKDFLAVPGLKIENWL